MEQLIAKLDQLVEALDLLGESEATVNARAMSEHLIWSIKETEPDLLVPQLTQDLLNHINNAIRNKSNPNSITANLLNAIKTLPLPLNRKRSRPESNKLINELKNGISETVQKLESEKATFESSLAAQSSELIAMKNELEKAQAVIDTQSSRLDVLVNTAQATFDEKRSEIVEGNDIQLSELRKDLDEERNSQKTKYNEHLEELLSLISNKKTEADTKIEKLDKLLGLAGEKSLIADYSEIAKGEGIAAWFWSVIGSLILCSGVIIAGVVIHKYNLPDTMSFPSLISRLALPFSVFVPGFYCAAKARGHREVQIRARNTGVRLNTLEPFLTKFSDEKQQEIRAALVDEFFKFKETRKEASSVFGIHPKKVIEYAKDIKELS